MKAPLFVIYYSAFTSETLSQTVCHTLCPDTGVQNELHMIHILNNCLYFNAINNLDFLLRGSHR